MIQSQVIGKICITPKGAWSSGTAYDRLDLVTDGGGSYLAKQDVPVGTLLSDTDYWVQVTDKGDKGDTGATPSFSIGNVVTGEAGSSAAVTMTGTDEEPVLNLTIPRGNTGDPGNGDMLAPDYSTSGTYAVGDYVIYNGGLYRCVTAIATAEAWTAAHWILTKISNEIIDIKSDFNQVVSSIPNLFTGEFDESGYIDPSTGENKSSGSYKRTKEYYPLDVSKGTEIFFKTSVATSNLQIVIYNSAKSAVIATMSRNNTTKENSVTINENGYFRLYTNAAYAGRIYVSQQPFNDYGTYDNYKIPANALTKEVNDKVEKADLIYKQTGKNIFNPSADDVVEGAYIATDGTITSLSGWNTSGFIPVDGLSAIVASVWAANGNYYTYGKLNYLHTYNANKSHIAKIWDTSTDGVYTVASGVAFIRFSWQPNVELQDGRKLMIESGAVHSVAYEPYEDLTYLQESAYPTTREVKSMIKNGDITNDSIVCWGDSLTYSQYSENVTYPGRLATLTGKDVKNFGMPGASSMDISGLQGGMPMYCLPFTLPASSTDKAEVTFVDVNGNSNVYFGYRHYAFINNPGVQCFVDDIPVAFTYAGNNVYKLARKTTAENATVFDRPIKLVNDSDFSDCINIFWVGTNDAPTTAEKAQRTVDVIKNMVSHYGGKRYLVLGLTVKSYADAINDLLGQTFGNHYVDVKAYLINYGLADNNLSPTSGDTEDINGGIVPRSLRYDSVHFNDYGYTAVGNCVYRHGKDLGYWGD